MQMVDAVVLQARMSIRCVLMTLMLAGHSDNKEIGV